MADTLDSVDFLVSEINRNYSDFNVRNYHLGSALYDKAKALESRVKDLETELFYARRENKEQK